MRTLLRVQMEVEASNKAIKDGSLPKLMKEAMERMKPEAAYFAAMEGLRTAFIIFDMKDPSQMPVIAEPFFMLLNAKIDVSPVMNADDLEKGLQEMMKEMR